MSSSPEFCVGGTFNFQERDGRRVVGNPRFTSRPVAVPNCALSDAYSVVLPSTQHKLKLSTDHSVYGMQAVQQKMRTRIIHISASTRAFRPNPIFSSAPSFP